MNNNGRGDRAAQRKRYKEKYPEKIQAEKRKHYLKLKTDAIAHYSNGSFKCARCGEYHSEFLELVSINGGTKKQRKETRMKTSEYTRKMNYPPGYIVLCSNCNMKRMKEQSRINGEGGDYAQRKYYRRNLKKRIDVLSHYKTDNEMKCVCCGNSDFDVLCLDHINGNGEKHRKEIGGIGQMLRWTKKNGYPEGFRILCANCNQSLGKFGYCPHEKERSLLVI
jgi:hypothetical protein